MLFLNRYKESISKGTRSLKERLLSRNTSVKELSKEVQREMSAGIAGVAKMIERLDLASKRTGTSAPSSVNAGGPSSVLFKGKGVQESTMNRRGVELAPDLISAAPSYVPGTNSAQLEVLHQVIKLFPQNTALMLFFCFLISLYYFHMLYGHLFDCIGHSISK